MADRKHLGKYEILETLGKGAMGVVYKAFDPGIERVVALKTIRSDIIDADRVGVAARFRNEAKAAGRLNHPSIVAVYDFGEDQDVAFIAMEFVQGRALREFFSNQTQIPIADSVSIMVQLLDALQYAHERGVVHRDVKPGNIIIMTDGRLKVADFGIARLDASEMTQVGSVIGTPSYMAPEQFLGKPADCRSDLFSAGVVFYQLLTGMKPFVGSSESVAYKVCHENPPAPSTCDASLATAFDAVMAAALAKSPDERFQNARDFSQAIEQAFRHKASPAVSEETIRTTVVMPRPPAEPGTSAPGRSALTAGSSAERSATPPGWDPETLKAVESKLAVFVGPVARVLVRRAAHRTQQLTELVRIVAEALNSEDERIAFLKSVATPLASTTGSARSATRAGTLAASPDSALTPEIVERAVPELAAFLGPIAKVLVKKTAQSITGRRAFYLKLAENLGSEDERKRFLSAAGYREL